MSLKVAFAKKLLRLNDFQLEKLSFLYREDRQVLSLALIRPTSS